MKRTLSFILALLMCVSLLPLAALAEEEPAAAPAEAVEEVGETSEPAPAPELEPEPEPQPEPEPAAAEAALAEVKALQQTAETEAAGEASAPQETETYTITYYRNDKYAYYAKRIEHNVGDVVDLNEASRYIFHSNSPKMDSTGYCVKYTLAGWNTTSDANGTAYALTDTLIMPDADLELYAVWSESEQYHWELTVEGPGTVTYQPLVVSPGSDAWLTAREGDMVKLYVTGQRKVYVGTIHGFTPTADDGYIFDGWYLYDTTEENKLNVTKLTSQDLKDLVLSNEILDAGRNKIVAKFIENDGSYVSVKFQRDSGDGTVVYYQQMLKIGSDMPTVEDPAWTNHYFLGWDQDVPETVPENDITLTAQWLEGPTNENTPEELYTVRCTTGEHQDETQGMYWGKSNDDIRFDEDRGVYVCTVTLDRIGTYLGVGPACYNVLSGQEHFAEAAWPDSPVIDLVWNEDAGQWEPDGEQIVYVYHETGDEPVPQAVLDKMDPIICVTETGNADNYKELKLIEGTYDVVYYEPTGLDNNTRAAAVVVTDFDAYAAQLGNNYVPDWDSNLHGEDYYVFYLTRELETRTTANGSPYLAWTDWRYDKESTEFWTLGDGVLHNESSSGKELLVTRPAFTLTFTDALGVLPDQVFEVPAGDPYPAYDWTAEGVDPAIAEAVQNEEPVEIDGVWYTFVGWENYPLFFFGSVPTVSGDETFTAIWEPAEVYIVSFTDGVYDGEVFPAVEFVITDGRYPWEEYDGDLDAFLNEEVYPGLYDLQLEDGSIFIGWDPDLYEYAGYDTVTEDVAFEAIWAKPVLVAYRDGADGELFEDVYFDFLMGFYDFPEFQMEDGEGNYLTEPVREGYAFVDWVSFVDEEASYTFEDEDTGFTVNAYVDEDEGYTEFVIYLDAQWEPTAERPVVKAYGCSLSLDGDIAINFYLVIPEAVLEDEGAYVTLNNGEPLLIAEAAYREQSDITLYEFKYRVAAKEMGKDVVLRAFDGDGELLPLHRYSTDKDLTETGYHYSVQRYIRLAQESSTDAELIALMKAMSDYGSKAQMLFGYDTEHAAEIYNADDIAAVSADVLARYERVVTTTDREGVDFTKANLTLESVTTARLFFTVNDGTIGDYSFTVNGKAVDPVARSEGYAIELKNIAAKDLDEMYVVKVSDAEGVCLTVEYCALSYAYLVLDNGEQTQELEETVKALYLYNQAAKAYFD